MALKNEATIHRLFDERGFLESFEFIGKVENGKRDIDFSFRCKRCGAVSTRSASYYLYRYPRLICGHCGASSDGNDVWARSKECDTAMEFYQQGHSVSETAERFGVTKTQINNAVKARWITNGRDWKTACDEARIKRSEQSRIKREAERAEQEKKKAEKAEKRKEQADEVRRLKEIEKAKKKAKKEQEKANEKQRADAEKADALFHLLNDKTHVCSICGKYFSISDFMTSKGLTLTPTNPKYCSKECERKHNNRLSKECKRRRGVSENHRHRAKKYGCDYDSTVALTKLIKRDGLRCAICGEMCDPSDRSWSDFAGPMSPSIDHIIPMSKGGGHTWDNVQVAHIICNSYKGGKEALDGKENI